MKINNYALTHYNLYNNNHLQQITISDYFQNAQNKNHVRRTFFNEITYNNVFTKEVRKKIIKKSNIFRKSVEYSSYRNMMIRA